MNEQDRLTHCGICGSRGGTIHRVREMMFGFRDDFDYLECSSCGCLQLANPPSDMGRYYPADAYYSFHERTDFAEPLQADSGWTPRRLLQGARRWLSDRQREAVIFERGGIFGRLAERHRMEEWANRYKPYVSELKRRSLWARILDVGCGNGAVLAELAGYGFRSLDGIDPYLAGPIEGTDYRIRNVDVRALSGEVYDLILMTHSLEHIPDQVGTLSAVRGLLALRGVCRIEVPVAGSKAWSEYATDWIEIDAPRHYFLHTRRSMDVIAKKSGLEVYHSVNVGTPLEFWGSELYGRRLTLFDDQVGRMRDPLTIYSEAEMAEFGRRAAEANQSDQGGRIAFFLRRA